MRDRLIGTTLTIALLLAGCDRKMPATRVEQSQVSSYDVAESMALAPPAVSAERYKANPLSPVRTVAETPVSTFAVDVDTGAYANVRRFLNRGQLPPVDAVRTEEMINYFRYDYARPRDRITPFSVTTDVARTPWNADTRLLRVGLRGFDVARSQRPPANLVFLIDVSGSMDEPDKLPLVKAALSTLADGLRRDDKVGIVVYAGAAGVVLDPTSDPSAIKAALRQLQAGGSTAGGEGLQLAYDLARENYIKGGINRVMLATDGDFNVGITDQKQLERLIESERDDGITLTTLGFGQGNLNDAMMESIADLGNGNYAYIDSAMEAKKVLSEELDSTLFTIAKDVKVQVEFNPTYVSQYRLIGYENRALAEEDFKNDKVDAGDIGAGHQVTALYEIVPVGAKGWTEDRRYTTVRAKPVDGAVDAQGGELAYVRLRYKLPEGATSRLVEHPVAAAALAAAKPVAGDMAFVTAVAAFGQKLRGDTHLGDLAYADIRRLAGTQNDYWRQEFGKLVELAEAGSQQQPGDDGGRSE